MKDKLKYYRLTLFISLFTLFSSPVLAITRPIVFPISGPASFQNDFSDPRGGGTREHLATDIIANKMVPVVAVVDGVVNYIVSPEASWGYSISISDSEGYQYKYLHLNNDTPGTDDGLGGEANAYVAGITRGVRVTAGQHIGWVGDSGNAEAITSHLHFEILDPQRVPINPYDSLVVAAIQSPFSASIKTGGPIIIHAPEVDPVLLPGSTYIFTQDLSLGDTGEAVRQLQIRLKALGHFTSYVTNYFGPITRTAVVRYQMSRSIEATGVVGAATRSALNGESPLIPLTPSTLFTKEIFEGERSDVVRQLQTKLASLGYYKSPITDFFDSVTREAVRSFQVSVKLTPTGYVDLMTWTRLQEAVTSFPVVVPVTTPNSGASFIFTEYLSVGSRGEAVRQLQIRLGVLGYFSAFPTGYFGSITRAAVVNFQQAKGIEPLGVVGPKTRAVLNER